MIGQGDDAGKQAGGLALELLGIAAAVEQLVMLPDDGQDRRGKLQALADLHPVLAVHLVEVAFGLGQGFGLGQDAAGNLLAPDVVEEGAHAQSTHHLLGQPDVPGHHHGQGGDVEGVEVQLLAPHLVAHDVDGQFRRAEDGFGDLGDQLGGLADRFLGVGKQVFLDIAHRLGGVDEGILDPGSRLPLDADTLDHGLLGGQGLGHDVRLAGLGRWRRGDRLGGCRLVGIAQGRVVTHALQAQAADGPDLFLALDLEVAESEGMLKPAQIQVDVEAYPELINVDDGIVWHRWQERLGRDSGEQDECETNVLLYNRLNPVNPVAEGKTG